MSKEKRICIHCQKEFIFLLSQLNHYKGGGQFCSRNCHYSFYRANPDKHPCFKKDKKDLMGYRIVRVPNQGVQREHRYLMEKKLGRKLSTNEHVHHINGKKDDNRLENLVVLTASEHHRDHAQDPRFLEFLKKARIVRNKMWIEWRKSHWSHQWERCVVCKKTDIKHQGQGKCKKCYLKSYRTNGHGG